MPSRCVSIEISTKTIIKVVLVLLGLVLLYLLRDVIIILFASLVIAAALGPWVTWLKKRKVPRSLSVILIYLVLLSILVLSVYLLIPPILSQIRALESQFPDLYDRIVPRILGLEGYSLREEFIHNTQGFFSAIGESLSVAARSIYGAFGLIFGGLLSAILILVLSFYLIVQKDALEKLIRTVVPPKRSPYWIDLLHRINIKIGRWLSGQIVLCLIIGVLTFCGLWLLGLKEYALVLAIFAGIMEIIPYFGPIIGAVPAIFLAFVQSPLLALFVIILYLAVQQFENHVLVPKVMQKAIGLNPLIVILALMIGGKLAGVLGLILAVPVATGISVFARDFMDKDIRRRMRSGKKVRRAKT